jgi:TIR domain
MPIIRHGTQRRDKRHESFVSWSGEASHDVAKALKAWLPNVIQAVDVFLSSEDIAKGSQWFHELGSVLDESDFGILCLTRDNLAAPWILYEAGAIGKRLGQANVAPLLIGLTVPEVTGPLAQFNATRLEQAEIEKLVMAINDHLKSNKLSEQKLATAFQTWWPKLDPTLQSAAAKSAPGARKFKFDVFLSAPMAAFASDDDYKAARADIKKVFDALTLKCKLLVYWAAEKVESMSDFDALDVSVLDDLKALADSRHFVLLYPEKLVTSALFEAGYALALERHAHYFVRDRQHLPFLMRELAGTVEDVHIHTAQDWKTYDDLAARMVKYKDTWFPT